MHGLNANCLHLARTSDRSTGCELSCEDNYWQASMATWRPYKVHDV